MKKAITILLSTFSIIAYAGQERHNNENEPPNMWGTRPQDLAELSRYRWQQRRAELQRLEPHDVYQLARAFNTATGTALDQQENQSEFIER